MTDTILQVYSVFGDLIPAERHIFSATDKNLITMNTIKREFGSYDKFLVEYRTFCIKKRNKEVKGIEKDGTK